ncbi:MAG: exosortase C-terminal domain/associated protein EpsI [Candidatus Auribacterota bacterium]|jgi:EpsI family protein|uniref:EpsI family protein n=1 Tax=Candidatus Auribacter fodinae TaxID=2093366 RepID=A0A3A4R8B6_9BACT|nr:MAG: EpsI family protein [Candidatus Auribacter fodinae]
MKTVKLVILSIFFILAGIILWFGFYYNIEFYGKQYAQSIPAVIAGMSSTEIVMDQRTLDILETEDVLYRCYTTEDPNHIPLYLCVIFSENNRKVAHPPELCLSGGGSQVLEKVQINFPSTVEEDFDAQRLIVNHGQTKWMYLYWYKAGKFYSSHYLLQQFFAAVTQLVQRKSSCSLIRLSTPIPDSETAPYTESQERLVSFAQEVIPLTAEKLP